jgi:hypothetical protein
MAKEINIPVRVIDAEQAKAKIESVSRAGKELGGQFESGQTQAAVAVDKTSEKMNVLERILHRVTGQVLSFIAGWLGLRGVQALISGVIEKLQKVQQLQQDIYKSSLPLSDLGQKVVAATGVGTQQGQAEQIAALQKTGGLESPEIAQQMALAADAAYRKQGGVGNTNIIDFLKDIAPFIGAEQLSADDAAKLIELAGAAGVPATQAGFMSFAAKLQAGAKATKAKTFGEFFTGAQKSLTAYMAAGGTLEKGISLYAAGGESGIENILKLVTGLDKKEQHAVERSMKVNWSKLSTAQQIETFSKYVGSLPPQHRERILKHWGFPAGTAELVGGLTSSGEVEKLFAEITAVSMQKIGEKFTGTKSFKAKEVEGEATLQQQKATPEFAPWQQRFERVKTSFDILLAQGKDQPLIRDAVEPYIMAFGEMIKELDALKTQLPESAQPAISKFRKNIVERSKSLAFMAIVKPDLAAGLAGKAGYRYERLLGELKAGTINENELENPTAEKYFNEGLDVIQHPKEPVLQILKEIRHRMHETKMPNLMPPVIYNDHSLNFSGIVGSKSDRLIGPRAGREKGY